MVIYLFVVIILVLLHRRAEQLLDLAEQGSASTSRTSTWSRRAEKLVILPYKPHLQIQISSSWARTNLLAIHTIDKVSFLTDCSDGRTPQHVLRVALYNSEYTYCPTMHAMLGCQHYVSRVLCVLQRFHFSACSVPARIPKSVIEPVTSNICIKCRRKKN